MKQMSSLRWLWNQTRCHRLDIVANSVVGIVRASVSLSMVWVCKQLVDAATHGKEELLGEYPSDDISSDSTATSNYSSVS